MLEKSILKNFKINICNNIDSWEFKQKFQITKISSHEFVKKIILTAHIFEIQTAYRSCLDDDDETDFWNDKSISFNNLINISKKLHQKYHDFFNTWNADWLAVREWTDFMKASKKKKDNSIES